METIAIVTVEKLVVGDVFALMVPNSSKLGAYEVMDHKNESFGDGCTMAVKSLKDGIIRQANWHKWNQVGLISANFLPEEQTLDQLSGGKTLAELLETAI